MSNPFVGEIRLFAGNFAPQGWAFCDGSLLPISANETLFNLIGTTYGGDGQSTFALPDLRGRAPVHQGGLPGGGTYVVGQAGGAEAVTLTSAHVPSHGYAAADTDMTTNLAGGAALAAGGSYASGANGKVVGGNQPHENRSPYLAVSFIISLFGIFPSPT